MAVFDTGTSFTMIPDYYWMDYINTLVHITLVKESEVTAGYLTFPCEEVPKFPFLYFLISGNWF